MPVPKCVTLSSTACERIGWPASNAAAAATRATRKRMTSPPCSSSIRALDERSFGGVGAMLFQDSMNRKRPCLRVGIVDQAHDRHHVGDARQRRLAPAHAIENIMHEGAVVRDVCRQAFDHRALAGIAHDLDIL